VSIKKAQQRINRLAGSSNAPLPLGKIADATAKNFTGSFLS
jgi:hypothetical protein